MAFDQPKSLWKLERTATKLQAVSRAIVRAIGRGKNIGGKRINDRFALTLCADKPLSSEHLQMVRDVFNVVVQQRCQVRNALWPFNQRPNEIQAIWIGDRFQSIGAVVSRIIACQS